MRKIILFLFLCVVCRLSVFSQYWQQQVNYVIDVTLHDDTHTLDGFEKITYINNSPDTLKYIWFHLWPNAYKNDKTAFSGQLLQNGNTKFYFSSREQRGYMNRLDFKVNNVAAKTEDHPQHIDIIKVVLPSPLPPSQQITITTPFHVKLPFNFSRGGHDKQSYQLTQWYPKPAVYDALGWHPMPYVDYGEFYSEFGSFDVRITLPQNYVVAATGQLQNESERQWLLTKSAEPSLKSPVKKAVQKTSAKPNATSVASKKAPAIKRKPLVAKPVKTLQFKQDNIHDFAIFADTAFTVNHDTCKLASGKIVDVYTFYSPGQYNIWKNSVQLCKDALRFYSAEVGEYPYNVLSAVQGPLSFGGGMEYPSITIIAPVSTTKDLDIVLAHEIGHNWFYGALGSNERQHPWMDEGINSFYEHKYARSKYGKKPQPEELLLQTKIVQKKDQPIATHAEEFSTINYGVIAYYKAAKWIELLESKLGAERFKNLMQQYYQLWKFKHPQPDDFKKIVAPALGGDTEAYFALLQAKGLLPNQQTKGWKLASPFKPSSIKSYVDQPSKNLLFVSPVPGWNKYDKLMLGAVITNYKLPPSKFQFLAIPLYATNSKKVRGLANISYSLYPGTRVQQVRFGLGAFSFSKNANLDSNNNKVFESFYRLSPSIELTLKEEPRSTRERTIEARSFFIGERNFHNRVLKSTDSLYYVDSLKEATRYVNQFTYSASNSRALYPYDYQLQLQQGKSFYRFNLTANYFFNYAKGGGLNARLFAAKFGYLGNKDYFSSFIYQPKLLGVSGEEDYTYSNYFLGRTASTANPEDALVPNRGFAAQQIMIRDGALKFRLDQYEFLQGRSENWVMATNFNSTLPKNIFPIPLPLKVFLDVGTYSEAWNKNATGSRFLYVGGLQLSLMNNIINVYAPVVYSKEFRDNLKALPEQNTFFKRLTFSIDIHRIKLSQMTGGVLSL